MPRRHMSPAGTPPANAHRRFVIGRKPTRDRPCSPMSTEAHRVTERGCSRQNITPRGPRLSTTTTVTDLLYQTPQPKVTETPQHSSVHEAHPATRIRHPPGISPSSRESPPPLRCSLAATIPKAHHSPWHHWDFGLLFALFLRVGHNAPKLLPPPQCR